MFQLKIVLFPFSVIMAFVLVFGYIKPMVVDAIGKQSTLENREAMLSKVGEIESNVATLVSTLNDHRDDESKMQTFVPSSLDQDRLVGAINIVANLSGVIVVGTTFATVETPVQEAELTTLSSTTNLVGAEEPALPDPDATLVVKPKVRMYVSQISVRGTYDGIKAFFTRMAHMDRVSGVNSMKVALGSSGANGQSDPNVLEGSLNIGFGYFTPLHTDTAIGVTTFASPSLDLATSKNITTWVAETGVPMLPQPTTGKANPFLQ